MADKYLIFINDTFTDKQNQFYMKVKENCHYKTEVITYEDYKSEYIINILKGISACDLILVMCSAFFMSVEEELKKFLYSLYNIWFTNIIQICPASECAFNSKTLEGEKYYFPYSETDDQSLQAAHFILYAVNLFDKALIQDRLNDYICNSFREVVYSELLAKKNKGIKKINEELERKNQIDHLTGLLNRNGLYNLLENEFQRTLRDKWRLENSNIAFSKNNEKKENMHYAHIPKGDLKDHFGFFSLMIIEIDNFDAINDQYGLLKGDEVLVSLSEVLQLNGMFRQNDTAGRFSDSIFFILLPETSIINAVLPAQRLFNAVKTKTFTDGSNDRFNISVSIGISQFHPEDKSYIEIIQRATEALHSVRNRETEPIAVYEKPE